MQTPYQATKKHQINGKTYTIKPLSFFDALNLPDAVMGAILKSLPSDRDLTKTDVVMALRGQAAQLLADQIGCKADDFKTIPAEKGFEIVADWLEVNVTENFTQALARIVRAVKRIYSNSPSV